MKKKEWWYNVLYKYISQLEANEKATRRWRMHMIHRSHDGYRPSNRCIPTRYIRARRSRDPPSLLRQPMGSRRITRSKASSRHHHPMRPLRLFRRSVLCRQRSPTGVVPRPRRRSPRAGPHSFPRSRTGGRSGTGRLWGGTLRKGGVAGARAYDV